MMAARRVVFFFVLLNLCKVVSSVLEKFEDYPCPNGKQEYVVIYNSIGLNISCEQTWDFSQTSVADLHSKQCSLPCLQVLPGEIHLAECINVTLKIFCSVPEHKIIETRVHFFGKPNSSQGQSDPREDPTGIQRQNYHIGLCLFAVLAVVCTGCAFWFIKQRPRPLDQTGRQGSG